MLLALLLLRPVQAAPPAMPDAPVALAEAAVQGSPSLAALRDREAALRSQAEAAGVWPDPMVSVEYSNVPLTSPTLSSHMMAGLQLRVMQTLRPPGFTRLSEELAGLKADAAGHAAEEAALQLRVSVEQTWWLLTRSRMLHANTAAHLARAEELLSAARSRYETGSLGQHAVLRLEVLRDQLTDELQDFQRSERELTAALTAALGADPGPLVTPDAVEPLPPPSAADWLSLARTSRPLLARLQDDLDAAQTMGALARTDGRPDVSVWAGYRVRTAESMTDTGTDLVSVGLSLPIPVGSAARADAGVAEAAASADAVTHSLQAALDAIDAGMATTLARWERAASKATTYRQQLIPGAQSVLVTSQADFSVGRADFASLFEAEVALLSLERALIIAATETWLSHAAAVAQLGTSPLGATP
jgi:cobalt-zinc-cadmium efflux system outer membrane protein